MRRSLKLFKKRYIARHKRRVSRVKRIQKHPAFKIPLITFGVLLTVVIIGILIINRGQNPIPVLAASDSLIAIVTADGQEQTVPTRAKTVGELLERLEITLNDGDVVEPALDTEIVSDNYRVNVYRAKPVTILDGNREIRALSAAATPRSVARQVGIESYPEDVLSIDPAESFIKSGVIGQRLVVQRATPISVNLYGTAFAMRTQAKTVGEFLAEKDITLAAGETVQPAVDQPISTDEPIFVNRAGITVETVAENIPFETEYVEDNRLSFGVTAVRQEGTVGRRVVTYQINTETGEKTKYHEITVRRPIHQVVARGTYINIPNNKQAVMAAAGINPGDYMYVDYIVSRESTWNAAARNASSGAYGLCQALPATKMSSAGSDWETNAVTQLRWCNSYAVGHYGSWGAAYNFWIVNHWW